MIVKFFVCQNMNLYSELAFRFTTQYQVNPDSVHTGVLRDAMAHDTNREPGVYIGTSTGEVYASTNLGESWKKIASGLGRIQGITAFSPAV